MVWLLPTHWCTYNVPTQCASVLASHCPICIELLLYVVGKHTVLFYACQVYQVQPDHGGGQAKCPKEIIDSIP